MLNYTTTREVKHKLKLKMRFWHKVEKIKISLIYIWSLFSV